MTITVDTLERADDIARALGRTYAILGIVLTNELSILRPELCAEFLVEFHPIGN